MEAPEELSNPHSTLYRDGKNKKVSHHIKTTGNISNTVKNIA